MDDYLTTEDVARIARTSASTVRFWRHVGKGPEGFVVGRRVLYPRTEVETWITGLRESAKADGTPAA